MKMCLVLLSVLLSVETWADCSATQPGEVAYKVSKMTCNSCAAKITKQFSGMPQVASAKADYPSKCLKMKFKEGQSVSEQEVSTALDQLGFALIGKADNAANNSAQSK